MNLSIVVPCFNEEDVLPETIRRLSLLRDRLVGAGKIEESSRIYFIDDGSRDRTWQIINDAHAKDPLIKGIRLSRNRGHQNALLAGLFLAEGDALVSLDADLQDDVEAVEKMVDEHLAGNQVVYGVRESRNEDTAFKRITAQGFYKFMKLMGVETVHDHADYRLLGRPAVEALKGFDEVNMFLRGLVPLVGFQSSKVYYERRSRFAGESKYPLRKMIAFAIEGITSFSTVPLRIITLVGLAVAVTALLMSVWALVTRLTNPTAVPGWASTVLPIYFLGGVQLFSIGVIGEYLGKVYLEVKRRPRFIIEDRC